MIFNSIGRRGATYVSIHFKALRYDGAHVIPDSNNYIYVASGYTRFTIQ